MIKMNFFATLAALCQFPFLVSSLGIHAANGCIYDGVPNKSFEFTFHVSGSKMFKKDCPPNTVFNKLACDCIPGTDQRQDKSSSTPSDIGTTTSIPSTSGNCRFRENPDNRFSYLENTNQGWEVRACGNGTIFELHPACNCIHWDLVAPSCNPEIEVTTDKGKVVGVGGFSRYNVPIKANNVHFDSMGLDFNRSEIRVDVFNNQDYSRGLTIMFEFMEASTLNGSQVLFTNCDNNTNKFSLEVALIPGYVTFMIDVGRNIYFRKDVEFQPGGFKKVTAMYDGKQFTAFVDNKSGTMNKEGEIQARSYPMIIGNTECEGKSGFQGKMRRIQIYRCVKDDGFMP